MTTPKGGKTQTTTQRQVTEYPQWTQHALQNLVSTGQSMNNPFLQTPNFGLAGMNPDQLRSFDLARQMAQGAFTGGSTQINGSPYASAARVGPAAQATAAQVDGAAIAQGMNPYIKGVIAPAVQQAERARDSNQASIGTRAAAAGAFGGSREAIERGQADRAFQEGTATMVAQLMAQGYDQATALAQANAAMRQQAELSNVADRNQVNLTQAGYDQQAGMYNATVPLQVAAFMDSMKNSDQTRQQSALQALLGIGNQQQAFGQSALDYPFLALQRLAALTPQQLNSVTNSTGTQPNTAPSPLQSILGAGLSIAGMGVSGGGSLGGNFIAGLSDEKTKTNVQKLGKDPDTGLTTYAYDYKADVEAARKSGKPMPPKRVGPMAQEAKRAGAPTKKIGGNLAMLFGE